MYSLTMHYLTHTFTGIYRINQFKALSSALARFVSNLSNYYFSFSNSSDSKQQLTHELGFFTSPFLYNDKSFLVDQVVASAGLTVGLSTEGEPFSFGMNRWGQCGMDIKDTVNTTGNEEAVHIYKPTKIKFSASPFTNKIPVKFKQIDAGFQHGIALSDDGDVFTWGKGNRGQLGDGAGETSVYPVVVALDNFVTNKARKLAIQEKTYTKGVMISAGFTHTAVLGSDGNVFLWGKGMSNVLKPKKHVSSMDVYEDQLIPRKIVLPDNSRAIEICSSNFSLIIKSEKGNLWAIGIGEYDRNAITEPILVLQAEDYAAAEDNGVPCVMPASARLFKGHQRVTVASNTNDVSGLRRGIDTVTKNKLKTFEIILHNKEAYLKEFHIDIPHTLSNSGDIGLGHYSSGWQHSLATFRISGQ